MSKNLLILEFSPGAHIMYTTNKDMVIFRFFKMAAAILKNRKITISRPRFDRFRPNLARRRSSTLSSRSTVKNLKFEKSNHILIGVDYFNFIEAPYSLMTLVLAVIFSARYVVT